MTTRCEVTELFTDQCAHCRRITDEPAPNLYANRPQTFARFPGWCAGCGEVFGPGELIRSDGIDGWVAECCAGDAP
ncbi:hypothetical protein GCM10022419_033640 [Nonomuraea rosea]|uniref:Uncharacterized protein n=1 Tax=Nonomuraea rosea TaxID=638574 RepID=A0ABP6WGS1_9ACTN